jgi:zinc protease
LTATAKHLHIPVEHATLANGLRVVTSPDRSAPFVTVGVYYRIGFRLEPRGRSGFAHLFEHMMFQGSENAGKMEHIRLINSSGGMLNGTTNYDITNYFESVPSNALERVLWLEADRMRALKVDDENLRNQRDVVKEEVRVNVMNQPYGGFPWLDLPPVAFRNWPNAHNFYGDFVDLDAATLADVQKFFHTYYAPNNAVLVMLGDFEPAQAFALAKKYFEDIPPQAKLPHADVSEPPQTEERRGEVEEKFGPLPAIAIGYTMPPRESAGALAASIGSSCWTSRSPWISMAARTCSKPTARLRWSHAFTTSPSSPPRGPSPCSTKLSRNSSSGGLSTPSSIL